MEPQLAISLCLIYPDLVLDPPEGIPLTAIETESGWYPLLASLFSELRALSRQTGIKLVARRIKEKFGTLRVYVDSSSNDESDSIAIAELLIEVAEHISGTLCEVCGEAASVITSPTGWIRAACSRHLRRPDTYAFDESFLSSLLTAPLPKLDLSLLPLLGRMEESSRESERRIHLTLIRYRSLDSYFAARLSDIEIPQEIGWFDSYAAAREAAQALHCFCLETRSLPPEITKSAGPP